MIVTLSTPVIGLWLLWHGFSSSAIFAFRLEITVLTIFLLTLLLAIKQHLLTATLLRTLRSLSDTYLSVSRFMDQLTQNEKLASLGALVALVANQIKDAMAVIRDLVLRITPPCRGPPGSLHGRQNRPVCATHRRSGREHASLRPGNLHADRSS